MKKLILIGITMLFTLPSAFAAAIFTNNAAFDTIFLLILAFVIFMIARKILK